MSLPKLNTPVYETILPSTEKVIKYRPFLVKEEKLLLTALEDGDEKVIFNAVKQIIKNCVKENLKIEDLPTFDIEYLFLRLRAKSVGEKVTIGLKPFPCSQNEEELCKYTTEVEINLEEVKVIKDKKHLSKIMITDEVGIKMKYPDITAVNMKGNETEAGMSLIKNCIEMIFTEEETHERDSFTSKELDEFLDSMDTKQFAKIKQFFDSMPKLEHTINYKCEKCGEDKEITLQGLDSFFG